MFSVSGIRREKSLKDQVFYCTAPELRAEEREGNSGKERVRMGKRKGKDVAVCHL